MGCLKIFLDQFMIIFIDDIPVFSKTEEEHAEHLRIVLETLKNENLYAKLTKCKFWPSKVKFLGHVVNKNGIALDPGKVEAIKNWEQPRTPRNFLGLARTYRRFIQKISKLAACLLG